MITAPLLAYTELSSEFNGKSMSYMRHEGNGCHHEKRNKTTPGKCVDMEIHDILFWLDHTSLYENSTF